MNSRWGRLEQLWSLYTCATLFWSQHVAHTTPVGSACRVVRRPVQARRADNGGPCKSSPRHVAQKSRHVVQCKNVQTGLFWPEFPCLMLWRQGNLVWNSEHETPTLTLTPLCHLKPFSTVTFIFKRKAELWFDFCEVFTVFGHFNPWSICETELITYAYIWRFSMPLDCLINGPILYEKKKKNLMPELCFVHSDFKGWFFLVLSFEGYFNTEL